MSSPVIGWESTSPVPDGHQFNDYLNVRNGRLHYEDVDLASFFIGDGPFSDALPSPMEVVYLPKIRTQIHAMQAIVDAARAQTGYAGDFYYAYASKANAAEEVIRTTLSAGAHHEMSSSVDVEIALRMIERGLLTPDCMIIANGFKTAGSLYAQRLIELKQHHANLIPVLEDVSELEPFLDSGLSFNVGLRLKSYSKDPDAIASGTADSRFGMAHAALREMAARIDAAPNLNLVMLHAMVGGQITDRNAFVQRLEPPLALYVQLKQQHPSLEIFNIGGGIPIAMTLDFSFDYQEFWTQLLSATQIICAQYGVPVPDVMGEFGRYTTSEHGAHLFSIVTAKENRSRTPWYIIDGSIMSSFPDSWALGEHFIVLPLNQLDRPFQQVQLGGITCDSDDIYPPRNSLSPLYLPIKTPDEPLYIGFFSIGAYQEMLGGVRGSKHCVLPEANELIIDKDTDGSYLFQIIPGQTSADVLRNLGYA